MTKQKIPIGTFRVVKGVQLDNTRLVQFDGEKLATRTEYVDSDRTNGVTETLYYTSDGRLIVHVADWLKQEDRDAIYTTYTMLEVTRKDLQVGGLFEELGQDAWAWLRG